MKTDDDWMNYLVSEDVILARSRLKGEWRVRLEQNHGAYFHSVGEGKAYVQIEGEPEIELEPGDIVVFPQGSSHQFRGTVSSKTLPFDQFVSDSEARSSQDPDATTLLCGSFGIARYITMPAVKSLPAVLHLKAQASGPGAPLAETLELLCKEVENVGPGSDIVARNLLSTLFIYALRQWSETQPEGKRDWFLALQNQNVAAALACIHKDPANNWTVDTLAHEAGLSRSVFAQQFHDSVGETPHAYLTRWRIGIAAQYLSQTDISIAELAEKTGYNSESAFTRAFKQTRGVTPKQHRLSREGMSNEPRGTCAHTAALQFHLR